MEEEDFASHENWGDPYRKEADPMLMPWQSMGKMTDDELKAIWLYLKTLPPVVNKVIATATP
jgi:hypothetical protein